MFIYIIFNLCDFQINTRKKHAIICIGNIKYNDFNILNTWLSTPDFQHLLILTYLNSLISSVKAIPYLTLWWISSSFLRWKSLTSRPGFPNGATSPLFRFGNLYLVTAPGPLRQLACVVMHCLSRSSWHACYSNSRSMTHWKMQWVWNMVMMKM